MEISDVRVRLVDNTKDRLKAVCTVTFDDAFVVRDVKLVDGTHGLFVAMPSRKLTGSCDRCGGQNHLRAKYCNECGERLRPARIPCDTNGREKAHRDTAHPINSEFRQKLQESVLEAYRQECEQHPEPQVEDVLDDAPQKREHEQEFDDDGDLEPARVQETNESGESDSTQGQEVLTGYNSMIADLKGGEPRDGGRSGNNSSSQDSGRRRGRRGGRGGRDSSSEQKSSGRQAAAPVAAEPKRAPADKPEAEVEPVSAAPRETSEDADAFGAALFETPEPRHKTPAKAERQEKAPQRDVEAPAQPAEPVVETKRDDTDDDLGFGAGII